MHRNMRALKVLVESLSSTQILEIKNRDGKTPLDLAMFIKNDEERHLAELILSRDEQTMKSSSSSLQRPPSARKKKNSS